MARSARLCALAAGIGLASGCLKLQDFPNANPIAPDSVCANGVKDGDEADVDCGGRCPPCTDGKACRAGANCASGRCDGLVCRSCTDGMMTGAETAVDCGGPCVGCTDGLSCRSAADCGSGRCDGLACRSCTDSYRTGGEVDVDCGGPCPACAAGRYCLAAQDCTSATCVRNECIACANLQQDVNERGIDCGGRCAACGPESQANLTTAGDQTSPRVTLLADRSFMIVWLSGGTLVARHFDAQGAAVSGEIAFPGMRAVFPRADGGFVGVGSSVFARFDASGAQQLSTSFPAVDPGLLGFDPVSEHLSAMIASHSPDNCESTQRTLTARQFDGNGAEIGTAQRIVTWDSGEWSDDRLHAPVPLADGKVVYWWEAQYIPCYCCVGCCYNCNCSYGYGLDNPKYRIFSSANMPMSNETGLWEDGVPAITSVPGGGFAYFTDRWYGLFDSSGVAIGVTSSWPLGSSHAILFGADGSMLVVGDASPGMPTGGAELDVGRYGPDHATLVGLPYTANTYRLNPQVLGNVALDATGRFVIVWASQYQDGDGWGVYFSLGDL